MKIFTVYEYSCWQITVFHLKYAGSTFAEPAQIPAEPTYPSQHEIFWCVFGGVLHWENSHVFGECAPDAYALRWIA